MKLNQIKDNARARSEKKRLGRGIGSGLGKTSGRGGKGQTARSGVSLNGFEGGQNPIYRRLPKRGFVNIHAVPFFELTFKKIETLLKSNKISKDGVINEELLRTLRIMRPLHQGISLIATGELSTPMNIEVNRASKKVQEIVKNLGGTLTIT